MGELLFIFIGLLLTPITARATVSARSANPAVAPAATRYPRCGFMVPGPFVLRAPAGVPFPCKPSRLACIAPVSPVRGSPAVRSGPRGGMH